MRGDYISRFKKEQNGNLSFPTDDFRNRFVLENIGLVYKYLSIISISPNQIEDSFQDAVLGLIKAVDTWDMSRGSFSQWAFIYMKKFVIYGLHKTAYFHVPEYLWGYIKRYKEYKQQGYEDEDIKTFINVTDEDLLLLKRCFTVVDDLDPNAEKAKGVKEKYIDPEDEFLKKELRDNCLKLINSLKPIQRDTLLEFYGFNGTQYESFQEYADKHNMSRQGAWHNHKNAIKNISKMKGKEHLREWFDQC